MSTPLPEDMEYEERVIDKVEGDRERGWWASFGCWSIGIDKTSPIEPKVGMVMRQYGRGIGYEVRGIVIDGVVVRYQSPAEYQAYCEDRSQRYEEEDRKHQAEPKCPDPQIPGFEWTEDMRQISGFGGSYERACRLMVSQGCRWWAEHPDANPIFRGLRAVYGIALTNNDDAQALDAAIMANIEGATGAMHQASIAHVMRWRQLGSWIAYQREMRASRAPA